MVTNALGHTLILICVFACGAAAMTLGEKFGKIPNTCIIEQGALELIK